jgi:dihydrofolate reductase
LTTAAAGADNLFIIGGDELYAQALALADRLQLTEIDAEFDGDTYFPAHDRRQWRQTSSERHTGATGLAYAFVTYDRI